MERDQNNVTQVPFAERTAERRELLAEAAAVDWLLDHYCRQLPQGSATRSAVARGARWEETLRIARWEGAEDVAGLLQEALDVLGGNLPPRVTGRPASRH